MPFRESLPRKNPTSPISCWRSCAVALCCFQSASALGQSALPPQIEPTDDSMAPRPAMVVQNRFFKKAFRPEFSVFGGPILNEAYASTYGGGVRLGMFINEYWGFDYSYTYFSSDDSPDYDALTTLKYYRTKSSASPGCQSNPGSCSASDFELVKVKPSFSLLQESHSAMLTFAPIYGKINLLDFYILYSDIYASAGTGLLKTTDGNKYPVILGVGQRFFFAKSFSLRVDGWDHIYGETRINQGKKVQNTRHAWLVSVGASVFLLNSRD